MAARSIERDLALQLGKPRYMGAPCKHGHSGERYTSNRCCVACNGLNAADPKYAGYYRKFAKERRDVNRQYIREQKSRPCVDCGKVDLWYVMEFDHRDGRDATYMTVSNLVGYSLDRIKAEMNKCDLLCARCHKIRTHERAVQNGSRHE